MIHVLAAGTPPSPLAFIPSPPASGIALGPVFIHVYGLMYAIGIALAVYLTARRWAAAGGDRAQARARSGPGR